MTSKEMTQQHMVAGVRFSKVGKLYHFDFSSYPELQVSDFVIVETVRGRQMGQVMAFAAAEESGRDYKSILRPATPRDLVLKQSWEAKQPEVLEMCREKASHIHGLGRVKFIAAQYNYDGTLLTIMYSADDKPNMNRLQSEMNRMLQPTHVELRQIGPRDVAKLLGGYGACGELRCCSTFLTDFSPISIKMAKSQGISLNPSEITGMCGRLRCCLVYEYEQYVAARQQLPKKNKRVGTPFGEGRVLDIHPLQDAVTVYIEEEGRRLVQREDLIPLDELEALSKKAKEPCNIHGDGPCDCGAKPGKKSSSKPSSSEE
jgi:cell fate regulator YaaT (PSP1 superfamily)